MNANGTYDKEGMQMLAACVAANVESANFTTNALIQSVEDQRDYMARALADMFDALDRIPDFVRTVAVEKILARASVARETAERYLK